MTTRSRTVLKFQLHDHIAREILKQDPRECNYFGNPKVGDFLRVDPRASAPPATGTPSSSEATGEGLTARPMVAYFAPLMDWLKEQNKGRKVGWA